MVSLTNSIQSQSAVQSHMLQYIENVMNHAECKYHCPVNSDEDWLRYGIARVLHSHHSGRDFFQSIRMESLGEDSIKRQDFQEGLKSKPRLNHLTSINTSYLLERSQYSWRHTQGGFDSSLDSFHIYAADGHFHAASTHDSRDEKGKKHAIGHLYSLNLRNRDLNHLALSSDGSRKKPHDMGTLKRMEMNNLKQGSKKGQKVLYVWDRACIDLKQWTRWKHNNGIYFLTRTKKNMERQVIDEIPFEQEDPANSGILKNQYIAAEEALRMITYHDIESNETFEFITNLHQSIPPGVIVQLYRMRWDIEKVFDDIKNKLEETKAWSKSLTGKRMQAQFITLTYNLLHRTSAHIEREEKLRDETLVRTETQTWSKTQQAYSQAQVPIPTWRQRLRRITQIGVKFIRWARVMFLRASSWEQSLRLLAYEYSLQ